LIFEFAGVLGIEPWTFTFGELSAMATARQAASWEAVSALLAMTYNVHCTRKSQTRHPAEFNPIRNRRKRLSPKKSIEALLSVFVRNPNK
jgi:hypothetical protein